MTTYLKPLADMDAVSAAAATLKALANEHRLLLLCALAERPMSVSELNLRVPIAQSALSQHLARLRTAGVVKTRRCGPQTRYELIDARCRRLLEAVCANRERSGRELLVDLAGDFGHGGLAAFVEAVGTILARMHARDAILGTARR